MLGWHGVQVSDPTCSRGTLRALLDHVHAWPHVVTLLVGCGAVHCLLANLACVPDDTTANGLTRVVRQWRCCPAQAASLTPVLPTFTGREDLCLQWNFAVRWLMMC